MGRTITNTFFLMLLAVILISADSIITESQETSTADGKTDKTGNTSDQTTANRGTIDKTTNTPVTSGSAAMGGDGIIDPAVDDNGEEVRGITEEK